MDTGFLGCMITLVCERVPMDSECVEHDTVHFLHSCSPYFLSCYGRSSSLELDLTF